MLKKILFWIAVTAAVLIPIFCLSQSPLVAPTLVQTGPPPPPPTSAIKPAGLTHTNKPFGPPSIRHWSTVWFFNSNAPGYLSELDESTNLKTWFPIAYYPCDGTWKSFTVSNLLVPQAYFRAKTISNSVVNLKLVAN
jgi:hypothetical protein